MKIRALLKEGCQKLEKANVPDAKLDSEYLLCSLLGTERMKMLSDPEREIGSEIIHQYDLLIEKRASRQPLQYILGTQYFYGVPFAVNEDVLIPRQDTEALCEHAIEHIKGRRACRVLDLCTGSGILAITIKRICVQTAVFASDISQAALSVAEKNANMYACPIEFRCGDLFVPWANDMFDLILSNPPYIPAGIIPFLQEEVTKEPSIALDGGTDGLDFYRKIIHEAPDHLNPGGMLFLEIGDNEREAVERIMDDCFCDITCKNDLSGLPRVLYGEVKPR